jgi:hypothetical protein
MSLSSVPLDTVILLTRRRRSWASRYQKLRYKLFLIPGELIRPQNRPVLRLRPSPMTESLAATILARAAKLKHLQP